MPDDQNVAAVLSQVAVPHLPNQQDSSLILRRQNKNKNRSLYGFVDIQRRQCLSQKGHNYLVKFNIQCEQDLCVADVRSRVLFQHYCCFFGPILLRETPWCVVIKLLSFITLFIHHTLRKWDQYKSQMYYINCGFILVPKFCSFSMQCDHGTNYSTDAFFFVSRNKYTRILSWHALGPI